MDGGMMLRRLLWASCLYAVCGYVRDLRYRYIADVLSSEDIEKGCGSNPADIVFVLDESGSIWGPDFDKQKGFVKDVVRLFDVGHNRTHIGVETFGTDVKVHVNLGKYADESELLADIDAITQRRGQTNTRAALEKMRVHMFSDTFSRPWVSHLCIVITDGASGDPDATKREAELAKQKGITLFSIGVGESVRRNELLAIATSPEHMYTVTSYSALEKLKKDLAWKACLISTLPPPTTTPTTTTTTTTTTTPTPPPQSIPGCEDQLPVDVVFSVPGTADAYQSAAAYRLIKAVLADVLFGPRQVQAGLAPRRWAVRADHIRLMDHDTKQAFFNELDLRLPGPARLLSQLVYLVEHAFTKEQGGRDYSAKVGILIIDSPLRIMKKAKKTALTAQELGVQLVYIGVGEHVREAQLRRLAEDPSTDVLLAPSYESLPALEETIKDRLCDAIVKALYGQLHDR